MALFGYKPPVNPLIQQLTTFDHPTGYTPQQPAMPSMPPQQSGKFFGAGGFGPMLLGAIGDALAQQNGVQPLYAPNMMALRQQRMAADAAEAKRQADMQDWQTKYDYEANHPKQTEDVFTRALAAAGIMPGTPEYTAMAHKRAEMLTNPVQIVSDGMGGYVAARPYQQPTDIPTAPVGDLMPYNGGPTPAASGNFRPRF